MNLGAKIQPVLIFIAAVIGLLLGEFIILSSISEVYIEIFLMMMLYILFITVDLKQLQSAFKNIKYTSTAVIINFLFTPILAFILGKVFFAESIEVRIGLLMLLVTPCTDWYLVFTGLSKGNVELNMSILPINLILQVVLMPIYLFVFLGSEIQMHVASILQSIILVLFIPFVLALLTKQVIKSKTDVKNWLADKSDNLQLVFLCLAVVTMFTSQGENLFDNPTLFLKLFVPLIIFFTVLFVLVQVVGRLLKFEKRDIVALNFTTLARNSPLSLAIAVATFPDYPLVSLALVIGPLIELPVLGIISNILLKCNTQKKETT